MTEVLELWLAGYSAKTIARQLNIRADEVYRAAYRAGIRRTRQWTEAEDKIISRYYYRAPAEIIARLLPGRTPGSVWARYWRLKSE